MANFLLVSMLVHTPPSSSDLSVNDVIEAFWDDSTDAITVEKNGSPWGGSAGGQVGIINTNFYVSGITSYSGEYAISAYSFCNGNNLEWFRMVTDFPSFPFMQQQTTVDSPVCGTNVCDIHFNGPAVVTYSTSLTNPNGQIIVSASSTIGAVKYSLTDFTYSSGGQLSGTFTGLSPGFYTLWAKDSNDCTAQITFNVFFQPQYSEHYRFVWTNRLVGGGNNRTSRVRIYEREYVGDLVEINNGGVSPFTLRKPKPRGGSLDDKFYPVNPTSAELNLISEVDYQYLPLFTQDDKRFKVVYEVDEGGGFEIIWTGFILPSVYQEEFVSAPYEVQFQLTDNMALLEREPFTDDNGNLLNGQLKLITVISHILKKTGLEINIQSGINIFETTHNTAATDDPLDQTYIDVACYRDGDEPFTCWEVLENILRPFGARIYQYDNAWIIEEVDRATTTYAYRTFDYTGDFIGNGTFDPIVDIKPSSFSNRAAFMNQDQNMEIIPAYGKIDVKSRLNYTGSIVTGGFEKEDLLSPEAEITTIFPGIFKTEEGFKGWTLRLNGASGVSFGRVVVYGDDVSKRIVHLIDADEAADAGNRSAGVFYYHRLSWSGNLRESYIESAAKPFQYGPNDDLNFSFEYSTGQIGYPFAIIRFMIRIGNEYLQQNLSWSTTPNIYRTYPSPSDSFEKINLIIPLPGQNSVVDTTIQVRVYFYAPLFFDYGTPPGPEDADGTDGLAGFKALDTEDITYAYRVEARLPVAGSVYHRGFYELIEDDQAEARPRIVRPDDYATTTNEKVWSAVGYWLEDENINALASGRMGKFYVDNVRLDLIVDGQAPPEQETVSLTVSKYLTENLEVELYNFDCPDIVNAKNQYNNYFRLSDGSPTTAWTRSGVNELLPIQQILLKVLGANHSAPTFRLTGSLINEFSRIGINNYLRLTKQGSSLTAVNTEFTSNLNSWSQTGSGEAFAWSASNSGSAAVTLSGAESSQKIYQEVTHSGGYIEITANVRVVPSATNDREDILHVLFFRGSSIVHTEKMHTFVRPTTTIDLDFTYIAFAPGFVTRIGFFLQNINGTDSCTYQFGEFTPAGIDIEEVYQISDYSFDERMNSYFLELMQISKTYISLSGVDQGGGGQTGGGSGTQFSGAYSTAYGGSFDTQLN